MTVREHLANHHRATAELHKKLAKLHSDRSENCVGPDQTFHKAMGEAHAAHADHCLECCKDCEKAAGDDGLGKVSSINANADDPRGVRLISRFGQPDRATQKAQDEAAGKPDLSNVPAEFHGIVTE
jgi:hypothetical protein